MAIIDKTVKTRWNNITIKHYVPLGYKFTKYLDEFEVKVEDLPKRSSIKVKMSCDGCGKINSVEWTKYIRRGGEKYYCKSCAAKNGRSPSLEKVYFDYLSAGFVPLFDSYYGNNRTPLPCRCIKHLDVVQFVRYSNLGPNRKGCLLCAFESRKGINSACYKGTQTISTILRHIIEEWVKERKLNAKYTCELTGIKHNVEVHHLYPFYKIRDDLLESFGLSKKIKQKDVSVLVFERLVEMFVALHEHTEYVVINKSLHKQFHNMYGIRKFTPENFYEFKDKVLRGEICP